MRQRNTLWVTCFILLSLTAPGLVLGQSLQPKMGDPVEGLTSDELVRFNIGKLLFTTPLVAGTGLGPVFNKESCGNCHSQPTTGGPGTQTVVRFGFVDDEDNFDPLAELGGSLRQASTIDPMCAEMIPPEANITAERITTSNFGIGLIEAIPDDDLLALTTNGGIPHMVEAFEEPGVLRVGRFGWKAQVPTVLTFSADAALNEMGLTNRFIMEENAPNGDEALLALCDTVPDPEDGPDAQGFDFIDRVTDFQRFLAAPPQTPMIGMTGEVIFNDIGCADCHHTSHTTADDPALEDALRNKTIKPYSDFLLHNMGVLGDGIEQGAGIGTHMRTAPLWGLRSRTRILHDGRAGGGPGEDNLPGRVDRAIVEHGGDGFAAAQAYDALSDEDKNLLFSFLDSLGRAEFDYNGDNVVNEEDLGTFAACFTGDGSFYTPDDSCSIGDADADGDVDFDDYDLFIQAYEGVNGLDDCNNNGTIDLIDIIVGDAADCNGNAIPDSCDIADMTSSDSNANGIPDECELVFVRGDCNADGIIELLDATYELQFLFLSTGESLLCADACDVDDNGTLNIGDPIYNLNSQFLGGPPPPAPYPSCGTDPTPGDGLDCVIFDNCP